VFSIKPSSRWQKSTGNKKAATSLALKVHWACLEKQDLKLISPTTVLEVEIRYGPSLSPSSRKSSCQPEEECPQNGITIACRKHLLYFYLF